MHGNNSILLITFYITLNALFLFLFSKCFELKKNRMLFIIIITKVGYPVLLFIIFFCLHYIRNKKKLCSFILAGAFLFREKGGVEVSF